MLKSRPVTYIAALLVASAPAAAQPKPPPKAPAIAQTCTACHGTKGVSTIAGLPSLAGQPNIFTQYQLVFMRDGGRKPGVMAGIVKTLTDDKSASSAPSTSRCRRRRRSPSADPVDEAKAKALIKPRRCDNCHKEDYSGQGETGAAGRPAAGLPDQVAEGLPHRRTARPRHGRDDGSLSHAEGRGHRR